MTQHIGGSDQTKHERADGDQTRSLTVAITVRVRAGRGRRRVAAAVPQLETLSPLQVFAGVHGLRTLLELGKEFSDELILGVVEGGVVLAALGELLLLLHVRDFAEY